MERLFEPGSKGVAVRLNRQRAKEAAVREQERVRWLRQMRSQAAPEPDGWIRWRSVLPQSGWDVWYEGAGHRERGDSLRRVDVPVYEAVCMLCDQPVGFHYLTHGFRHYDLPPSHYLTWHFGRLNGTFYGCFGRAWPGGRADENRQQTMNEMSYKVLSQNGGHYHIRCSGFDKVLDLLSGLM